MQFATDISYQRSERGSDHAHLQLTRDGKPLFELLPGEVLEHAIRCETRLIVISSDYGFEGTDIHVLLLDGVGLLLDHVMVSDALSSKQGELSDVEIETENRFSFAFFPGTRMEVAVSPQPHWRLPAIFSSEIVYGDGFAWRGCLRVKKVATG